jgi:phosphoribosylamine-glycine ligase
MAAATPIKSMAVVASAGPNTLVVLAATVVCRTGIPVSMGRAVKVARADRAVKKAVTAALMGAAVVVVAATLAGVEAAAAVVVAPTTVVLAAAAGEVLRTSSGPQRACTCGKAGSDHNMG